MPKKGIKNIAVSVKEKLLNYSRNNSLDFNSVLVSLSSVEELSFNPECLFHH